MTETYDNTDTDVVQAQSTEHKNGESTHVVTLDVDGTYLSFVVELSEDGDEVIASKPLDVTFTEEESKTRADLWMDEHPKGLDPSMLEGVSL